MGRFSEIIRNGPLSRATRGNPWPLVASTLGGAIGGPILGQLAGDFVGRSQDRRDRRNAVPFSPSPADATAPQAFRDQLGLMSWTAPQASPVGSYGPLADGYAGLPAQAQPPDVAYDPAMTENLVQNYLTGAGADGGGAEAAAPGSYSSYLMSSRGAAGGGDVRAGWARWLNRGVRGA